MQIVGGLVVLSGVIVVNVASLDASASVNIGDFLILTGVGAGALGAVLFKRYLSHVMPELAVAIRNITAIVIVASFSSFLDHGFLRELASFPAEKVVLLLAFGFFSRYINLTCFYEALNRLPATTLSLLEIANPLFGMFFAVLLLGESLYAYHVIGAGLMVLGLVIEQMSETTLAKFQYQSLIVRFVMRDKNPMTHLLTRITRHS
jgi:drug/metabolite transporter (DMT)-like permease